MVNATLNPDRDPERALVLAYAPARLRPAMAALLALDDALGDVLRTTREPMLGQMRLTWWHDALMRLDTGPAPAQPVLVAIADSLVPAGVTGGDLAAMCAAWEPLLQPEIDREALDAHAQDRGARLFALAARVLGGAGFATEAAGRGWALADLGRQLSDLDTAAQVTALAIEAIRPALAQRWPRPLRMLGVMAQLAERDAVAGRRPGAPGRIARVAWRGLTGR